MYKKLLISFIVISRIVFTAVLCSCEYAKYEVSNLIVEPSSTLAGEMVSVTVDVTNAGGTEDTYQINLQVNGVEESNKNISLAPDASQAVTFNLTRDVLGVYEITVDELKGEFTVVDLDEILEKATQATLNTQSYHFTCTLEIEMTIPDDSLSFFEELP